MTRAPWVLAKDSAQADALDETLASLAEGLRVATVLLHPYMPEATDKVLAALGRPERRFLDARWARRGWGGEITKIDQKLNNANFVSRAPEEVIEEQRDRRATAEAAKQKLADALSRLTST